MPPITLNGTTGYIGPDGSAASPAIQGSDANTGIFFPAADTIAFAEGGVEVGRFDSSSNFQFNSGYGSVAIAYGCRAWVNFNGTSTVAIRGSGNVSSITDNGTGNYTVNYTSNMPDTNYAPVVSSSKNGGGASSSNSSWLSTGEVKAINSCLIEVYNLSSAYIDVGNIHFAVLR